MITYCILCADLCTNLCCTEDCAQSYYTSIPVGCDCSYWAMAASCAVYISIQFIVSTSVFHEWCNPIRGIVYPFICFGFVCLCIHANGLICTHVVRLQKSPIADICDDDVHWILNTIHNLPHTHVYIYNYMKYNYQIPPDGQAAQDVGWPTAIE